VVETRGRARYRPSGMRMLRQVVSFPLIVIGALIGLYGVFALIYNGDGSGPTYITIAGSKVDAHLAGGVSLAVAAALIGWGVVATRRGRRPSG
jgi:hypothetical protein